MTSINRRTFLKNASALAVAGSPLCSPAGLAMTMQVSNEQLRSFLNSGQRSVAGIPLRHKDKLAKIYAERNYIPLWSKNNQFTLTAGAVIKKLEKASLFGLHPSHYYTQILDSWFTLQGRSAATNLELVLTDSIYEFFDNLANGQTGEIPGNDLEWMARQNKTNVSHEAMSFFRGDASFNEALDWLQPSSLRYTSLLPMLRQYNQILTNGGFTYVGSGATLKSGMRSNRVIQLRKRLTESGDLTHSFSPATDTYDWSITEAVEQFQRRHGLDVDGMLGRKTLMELNTPVQQRIAQIEVNLDRWRWLPRQLEANHVIVNTAGFDLELMLDHQVVLKMDVIVGKPDKSTPIFSDQMEHLVVNPNWHVPTSIAKQVLLPKELRNRGYLDHNDFVAISLSDKSTKLVSSFSEAELRSGNFTRRYRLRQNPGNSNALGDIKFMFPNKYSVYLHDTNSKRLFDKTARAFSHGCVRVKEPQLLAKTLLLNDGYPEHKVNSMLDSKNTKTVRLGSTVPVHLTYQTSWVDEYGTLHFRPDIYGHDSHAINNYQHLRPLQTNRETRLLAQLGTRAASNSFLSN